MLPSIQFDHCRGEHPPCELSVVVPVYNEQDSLRLLDAEIRLALARTGRPSEIIYVDDGSRDASLQVLGELCAASSPSGVRTRVVRFRRNFGQTAAISAGFELAEGDVIFALDADGQNNPADIPRLLAELEKGYDVVSGWRKNRADRRLARTLPSQLANRLIARISGVALHDVGCTLKAYRASVVKELPLYGEMHRFIPVYLAAQGARVAELPVDHRPRRRGESKYGNRRVFKVLLDLLVIRFTTRYYNRPMHFFGQAAFGFLALMALCVALFAAIGLGWFGRLGIGGSGLAQASLLAASATFFVAAVVALFFGVVAEVLVRIDYQSRGQRPYKVAEIRDSQGSRHAPRAVCAATDIANRERLPDRNGTRSVPTT